MIPSFKMGDAMQSSTRLKEHRMRFRENRTLSENKGCSPSDKVCFVGVKL